jgi:hypothetical protein
MAAERTVQHMPVSTQTLDGRRYVVAFQKDNHPLAGRHHFRVFDTGRVDAQGRPVWAIAASRDVRLTLRLNRPTDPVDHVVQRDADFERNTVEHDALGTGLFEEIDTLQLAPDRPNSHLYSRDGRAFELGVHAEAPQPTH